MLELNSAENGTGIRVYVQWPPATYVETTRTVTLSLLRFRRFRWYANDQPI